MERALSICQQISRQLNPLEQIWQESGHRIGASFGLAMNTENLRNEQEWLVAADKACYEAKAGRSG